MYELLELEEDDFSLESVRYDVNVPREDWCPPAHSHIHDFYDFSYWGRGISCQLCGYEDER